MKLGKIHHTVGLLVDLPPKAERRVEAMSPQAARAVLGAVDHRAVGPVARLALATGMREGELLALRWQDVDLRTGTITVRGSLQRGTRELAPTKTSQGRRIVAFDRDTATMLAELRASQVRSVDRAQDFVFRTAAGRPLHARNVLRDLHLALKAAGLPRMPYHQLRRGYATLMLEAGIDVAIISEALGHSTIATTADIYMHVTPVTRQAAAEMMGAILSAQNDAKGYGKG